MNKPPDPQQEEALIDRGSASSPENEDSSRREMPSIDNNPRESIRRRPTSVRNENDPGKIIRKRSLIVFGLLIVFGIGALLWGVIALDATSPWTGLGGEYHPSRTIVTETAGRCFGIGSILLSIAGALLLPMLSLAAWRTSRWRCRLARQYITQARPVSSSFLEENSLAGWSAFWQTLVWLNAVLLVVLLVYMLAKSNSLTLALIAQAGILASVVGSGMAWILWCCLWVVCLKDQMVEVKEVQRLLKLQNRGNPFKWKEKTIKRF